MFQFGQHASHFVVFLDKMYNASLESCYKVLMLKGRRYFMTRSQNKKDSRSAHLQRIIDKILIACLGVTMEIIAEECWTDKVMGHKLL